MSFRSKMVLAFQAGSCAACESNKIITLTYVEKEREEHRGNQNHGISKLQINGTQANCMVSLSLLTKNGHRSNIQTDSLTPRSLNHIIKVQKSPFFSLSFLFVVLVKTHVIPAKKRRKKNIQKYAGNLTLWIRREFPTVNSEKKRNMNLAGRKKNTNQNKGQNEKNRTDDKERKKEKKNREANHRKKRNSKKKIYTK